MKAQRDQAAAQVGTARANSELAESTKDRYVNLKGTDAVSEQSISEKVAEDKASKATLLAAEAALKSAGAALNSQNATIDVNQSIVEVAKAAIKRLDVLQQFEKVVAPFDGIVTARNTEVGSLVAAGTGTAAQALFQLAKTDVVRVYVDVPQVAAAGVKDGQTVQLVLREFPDAKFSGEIARTTRSIDPSSRTLRTEVRVKNPTGELLRGMYTQVKLNIPRPAPTLFVPGSALIVNADGTQLALVKDGHVHFQKVVIEGDYGKSVGISAGLAEQDTVIANPSERLQEGMAVTSAPAAQ